MPQPAQATGGLRLVRVDSGHEVLIIPNVFANRQDERLAIQAATCLPRTLIKLLIPRRFIALEALRGEEFLGGRFKSNGPNRRPS